MIVVNKIQWLTGRLLSKPSKLMLWLCCLTSCALLNGNEWWDANWGGRVQVTVNAHQEEAGIDGEMESVPVLLRLHAGNFPFAMARPDGGDLRFIAEDNRTELPYHIEKYDELMQEALVWVQLPVVSGTKESGLWIYYGSAGASSSGNSAATYDADTVLVYHFNEAGHPPRDYSASGNHAETEGIIIEGSQIGSGMHLNGSTTVTIPVSDSLEWDEGEAVTWSAWVKLNSPESDAVLFSRGDGPRAALRIGFDGQIPFVEISGSEGTRRTEIGEGLVVGNWYHLAVVASPSETVLYLDGSVYRTLERGLPELKGPMLIGGDTLSDATGFIGELDTLKIAATERSSDFVRFAAVSQGGRLNLLGFVLGDAAGGAHGGAMSETLEHVLLFGDIAGNMMFDGWIAVGICILMIIVGWSVAFQKFRYMNKIEKGTNAFLQEWKKVSSDLSVLDPTDAENVDSLGGTVSEEGRKAIKETPLFQIYLTGSEEVCHRLLSRDGFRGLSERSIKVIKTSLDGVLSRELQRINNGLVYLTISIAGGPYVGLLGTVVGVMITFALISKTGEVEVNTIAPGIASALLATVAGLIVAIPALFMYSYLNTRIKNVTSNMRVFIEEFTSRMAELYPITEESEKTKKEII